MAIVVYTALLVVGVVLLVTTVVRVLVGGIADSSGRPPAPTGPDDSARALLDERYAAGKLSTEEYEHRLRVLEGGR